MKERPLPFSARMVIALAEGAKTQTRRICRNQRIGPDTDLRCPYGAPGDRLYVTETWAVDKVCDSLRPKEITARRVCYAADDPAAYEGLWYSPEHPTAPRRGRWRPGRFMVRWCSRYLLEVVSTRVERLQDISEPDAKAEGVGPEFELDAATVLHGKVADLQRASTYRLGFKHAWDEINEHRGGWAANPFVWVVDFRRV